MELIESGMRLFAQKGFHKTSVQEIASETGISKGAFYLYFNSKEDFVMTAFQYFYTQIRRKIAHANMGDLPPRQSLSQQINIVTNYIYEKRDFIIMHFREDISIGDHAVEIFHQIKIDNYHWLKENVQAIYGAKIDHYLFDIIIQLEGLMNGYFQRIVIDNLSVERDRIGPFITSRLDEIVQGMLQRQEDPLIPIEKLPTSYQSHINERKIEEKLQEILFSIKGKISNLDIHSDRKKGLQEVVEIVLQKIIKQDRQNIMIQGLLAHFTNINELKNECEEIAKLLQIKLLD